MLGEIAAKTSGDLTSVEVISYVEALSRSAWRFEGNQAAAEPGAINATLTVSSLFSAVSFFLGGLDRLENALRSNGLFQRLNDSMN